MAIILNGNITADGNTSGASINNPNNGANIFQVIYASGDFGSGTLTVQISNDGGTTWYAATDSTGSVTLTDDGAVRTFLLGSNDPVSSTQVKIRLNLSGATNPDIDYIIADAR